MTLQLQLTLIIATLIVFLIIIRNIKKSKLNTEMAIVWIIWAVGLILIAIFPQIIYSAGKYLGIETPINTIFLIMIFLLYMMVFFLYLKISLLQEKLKNLIQVLALKEEKIDEDDTKN